MTKTWEEFAEFLGAENIGKIKDTVTKMMIESIEDALNRQWIFVPDIITEEVESFIADTVREYFSNHRDAIKNLVLEDLSRRF